MMKKILLGCVLLVGAWLHAEQTPVFFGEDFANQSLIFAQNSKASYRCQAVRIAPKWYLTAAHCVRPYCDKECQITVQLLQGPLQASARLMHTSAAPRVFVPPAYRTGSSRSIRADLALIRFDPAEEEYFFYEAASKQVLDKGTFIKRLNASEYADQRGQWQALENARPKLLSVNNSVSRRVLFPLAVPDLREDGIFFKQSAGDFYYFTELRHYMGPNFGVEKGMSGSGVVLPGGEVIGVVSSRLNNTGKLVTYNEKDEPVGSVPYSSEYFLFTPVSRENAAFIRATVNSFHEAGLGPRIVSINSHYADPSAAKVQEVFSDIASAEEVVSVKERQ